MGVCALLKEILSLLKISVSSLEVEDLLDLLDFLLSDFEFSCNGYIGYAENNESILGFIKKLKSLSGLGLGVIPALFNSLDISLEELGFVGVLEDDLAFVNEVSDNVSLGVKLLKGLFLSLNKLINILNTRGSNFSGGGKHNSVKELNMGLQLVTIGITLPVQVNHDGSLLHIGDKFLVFLDEGFKLISLSLLLILGTLGHEDLKDLCQPFLDFSPLEVFAQRIKGVSLALELCGGVDFVAHDTGDSLLNILQPFGHLGVSHLVDLLDKLIILLPERHLVILMSCLLLLPCLPSPTIRP